MLVLLHVIFLDDVPNIVAHVTEQSESSIAALQSLSPNMENTSSDDAAAAAATQDSMTVSTAADAAGR